MKRLPLDDVSLRTHRMVRQKVEQAVAVFARAGQRDPGLLERYARSRLAGLLRIDYRRAAFENEDTFSRRNSNTFCVISAPLPERT